MPKKKRETFSRREFERHSLSESGTEPHGFSEAENERIPCIYDTRVMDLAWFFFLLEFITRMCGFVFKI